MKTYTITVNGNVYDVTVEENVGGAVAAAPVAPYNLLINAVPKRSPASHFRPFKDTAHVLSQDGRMGQKVRERVRERCGCRRRKRGRNV